MNLFQCILLYFKAEIGPMFVQDLTNLLSL